MRSNRILSTSLLLFLLCYVAKAQLRMDVICMDKNIVSIPLNNIRYLEIVEGAGANELDGPWFLGWKYSSGTHTHYDGTEVFIFSAGKMTWSRSTTDINYSLTYSEGGAQVGSSFKARREGSTTDLTYTILVLDKNILAFKQGSTYYYLYRTQEAALQATTYPDYPTRVPYTDPAKLWASSVKGGDTSSKITPMGKHFEKFSAATDNQRTWLANPNNQPDPAQLLDDTQSYKYWTAKSITLYPFGEPTPADVNQTAIGDCCMCASFASFAYLYPEWVKTLIEENGNNYTVHMFDPMGNPIDVVVDNKLLCNSGGGSAQVRGKNGKFTWSTILEKALMKWETCFGCNHLEGIPTEHAIPPFTGSGSSYAFDWNKLYDTELKMIVEYNLGNGMLAVGGFHESGHPCGPLESVTGHAFTAMLPDEGADYMFVMRNPWGSGGYPIDGKLEIPYNHDIAKLIDIRFLNPGSAAPYKRENLTGYTAPRYIRTNADPHPTEELLRRYNLKSYEPLYLKVNPEDEISFEEEAGEIIK